MHRRFGAPLGGQTAHGSVDLLIEAEQVADHSPVQEGAVGVCVREVGGFKLLVPNLVEDGLGRTQLLGAQGAEVQDAQGCGRAG